MLNYCWRWSVWLASRVNWLFGDLIPSCLKKFTCYFQSENIPSNVHFLFFEPVKDFILFSFASLFWFCFDSHFLHLSKSHKVGYITPIVYCFSLLSSFDWRLFIEYNCSFFTGSFRLIKLNQFLTVNVKNLAYLWKCMFTVLK